MVGSTRTRFRTRSRNQFLRVPAGLHRRYETTPSQDPAVGLCLGPYGGSREGGGVSYERGTPVGTLRVLHFEEPLGHSTTVGP